MTDPPVDISQVTPTPHHWVVGQNVERQSVERQSVEGQSVEWTKCRTDTVSNRQSVEQTQCRTDKCRNDKVSSRQSVEIIKINDTERERG